MENPTKKPPTPYIERVLQIMKESYHNNRRLIETYNRATELHGKQMYGDKPYMEHVCQVFCEVWDHRHLCENIPPYKKASTLFISLQTSLFHDVLEDCDITYNDIKRMKYNENSAKLELINSPQCIYNITNDLGKDRVERNVRTYLRMRDYPISIFVKLCDRLANMKSAKENKPSMFKKYKKELHVMKYILFTNSEGDQHKWSNSLWDELFSLE